MVCYRWAVYVLVSIIHVGTRRSRPTSCCRRPKPNRKWGGGKKQKNITYTCLLIFVFIFFFCFFFIAREPVVLQHGRGQQNHDQRFRSVQDRGLGRDGHGLRNSRIRRYVTVLCSVFELLNRQNEEITVRVDSKIYGIFFLPLKLKKSK